MADPDKSESSDAPGGADKPKDFVAHYAGLGFVLGSGLGGAFGAAFGNIGIGLGVGVALGLIIGAGIGMREKKMNNAGQ